MNIYVYIYIYIMKWYLYTVIESTNGMYIYIYISFYIFTLIKCDTVLNPSKFPQQKR